MKAVRFFDQCDKAHSEKVVVGNVCRKSFNWIRGEGTRTNVRLPGTCAIEIQDDWTEEEAIGFVANTYGTHGVIAVIEGEFVRHGNDQYEVILANAKIVRIAE